MMDSEVMRPNVSKSFIKGYIAVALFSVVLDINSSNFYKYLAFLGLYTVFLVGYAAYKHSYKYEVTDEGVRITPPLRSPRTVDYSSVVDVMVSQGVLAKRFGCGTVFLATRTGKGGARGFGGGRAEVLRDVRNPGGVADRISGYLSPFQG